MTPSLKVEVGWVAGGTVVVGAGVVVEGAVVVRIGVVVGGTVVGVIVMGGEVVIGAVVIVSFISAVVWPPPIHPELINTSKIKLRIIGPFINVNTSTYHPFKVVLFKIIELGSVT